jgi:4-carboxymuconolactone decarboxylase
MARFERLADAALNQAQREVAAQLAAGPRGRVSGPYIPLLYSPGLAGPLQKAGAYLRFSSQVPQHLVELTVLVTARACAAPYVWQAHLPHALKAGLPEAFAAAVGRGEQPEGDASCCAVWAFATELHRDKSVTDATFDAVTALVGRAGAIELVGVCGYYTTIALVLNTAEVALPAGREAPFGAAFNRR